MPPPSGRASSRTAPSPQSRRALGTIGLELAAAAELDSVVVPLGDGALLAGVGAALRYVTRVIAVVAAGAPAMQRSLAAGQVVETGGRRHHRRRTHRALAGARSLDDAERRL